MTPELSPLPANIARVLITGFMGAGKTTVGRMLAERLGWDFADSDHLLEARAGQAHRRHLREPGRTRLPRPGGGHHSRHCRPGSSGSGPGRRRAGAGRKPARLLASLPDSALIFLDAPLDVLVSRCSAQPDAPVRPVLADRARLQERWTTRLPWYRQAHLTVNTEGCTPRRGCRSHPCPDRDRCGSSDRRGDGAERRPGPASPARSRRTGVPA